jgi:hypothetical protein
VPTNVRRAITLTRLQQFRVISAMSRLQGIDWS